MFNAREHRRNLLSSVAARLGTRMGHAPSMVDLGALYESGNIEGRGISDANRLYREAAEAGHPEAMCRLGINFLPTKGGETDTEQAIHWLTRATELGEPMAAWALGCLCLAGSLVEKDPARGIELLHRSAAKGYKPACLSLAGIYRSGSHGVSADPERAVEWFIRSRDWFERLRIRLRLARVELGE